MTFRRHTSSLVVLGACVLGVAGLGCQGESSSSIDRTVKRPGPEESFQGIVRFVESQIETGVGGMPSGFVMEKAGRRSQFRVHNDVTSELIPPAQSGETYRGKITITSSSTYWLRRTEEADHADNGAEDNSDPQADQRNMFDDPESDDEGIDVIDSDLVSSAPPVGDSPLGRPTTIVARQEDENVSTFEFAYENDRWVLKTEPDAATERAIKRAFERALRMQP
jgi:hypothetical protein